jgi:hypothetical protein
MCTALLLTFLSFSNTCSLYVLLFKCKWLPPYTYVTRKDEPKRGGVQLTDLCWGSP